jgi:hypothetical protein
MVAPAGAAPAAGGLGAAVPSRSADGHEQAPASAEVIRFSAQRDAKGRFSKGHTVTVRHGLHSQRDVFRLDDEIAALVAGAVEDLGGAANVPTRVRALVETRFRLHRRFLQVDSALETVGLFDRQGKLRTAWLQRLEGIAGAMRSIDSLLGLDRKPRDVTPTLESYIREKYARSAQQSDQKDGDNGEQ